MRWGIIIALAAFCGGCASSETVQFKATGQQQALTRDGQAALVSRGRNSVVLIRPAQRQFKSNARPVFVVGMTNIGHAPLEFRMANVEAAQTVNEQTAALKVITYEELVGEERTRQVARAVLVGVAAAGNAYSASQAGRYSADSRVVTPRGNVYDVHTTGISPTARAIAQSNAAAENEAMIGATIERGQANLANLERSVMKDNTLLPGEWYGGQLHLQPPGSNGRGPKTYSITLMVGNDRHEINIEQGAAN